MVTETQRIQCPYCGELIEIVIDSSAGEQSYIEDCSVCCRPIEIQMLIEGNEVVINARRDDE